MISPSAIQNNLQGIFPQSQIVMTPHTIKKPKNMRAVEIGDTPKKGRKAKAVVIAQEVPPNDPAPAQVQEAIAEAIGSTPAQEWTLPRPEFDIPLEIAQPILDDEPEDETEEEELERLEMRRQEILKKKQAKKAMDELNGKYEELKDEKRQALHRKRDDMRKALEDLDAEIEAFEEMPKEEFMAKVIQEKKVKPSQARAKDPKTPPIKRVLAEGKNPNLAKPKNSIERYSLKDHLKPGDKMVFIKSKERKIDGVWNGYAFHYEGEDYETLAKLMAAHKAEMGIDAKKALNAWDQYHLYRADGTIEKTKGLSSFVISVTGMNTRIGHY